MEWFDINSVATLFGVSRNAVRKWIDSGKLLAIKRRCQIYLPAQTPLGYRTRNQARILIPRTELENFLVTRTVQSKEDKSKLRASKRPKLTLNKLLEDGQEQREFVVLLGESRASRESRLKENVSYATRKALWARFVERANASGRRIKPAHPDSTGAQQLGFAWDGSSPEEAEDTEKFYLDLPIEWSDSKEGAKEMARGAKARRAS